MSSLRSSSTRASPPSRGRRVVTRSLSICSVHGIIESIGADPMDWEPTLDREAAPEDPMDWERTLDREATPADPMDWEYTPESEDALEDPMDWVTAPETQCLSDQETFEGRPREPALVGAIRPLQLPTPPPTPAPAPTPAPRVVNSQIEQIVRKFLTDIQEAHPWLFTPSEVFDHGDDTTKVDKATREISAEPGFVERWLGSVVKNPVSAPLDPLPSFPADQDLVVFRATLDDDDDDDKEEDNEELLHRLWAESFVAPLAPAPLRPVRPPTPDLDHLMTGRHGELREMLLADAPTEDLLPEPLRPRPQAPRTRIEGRVIRTDSEWLEAELAEALAESIIPAQLRPLNPATPAAPVDQSPETQFPESQASSSGPALGPAPTSDASSLRSFQEYAHPAFYPEAARIFAVNREGTAFINPFQQRTPPPVVDETQLLDMFPSEFERNFFIDFNGNIFPRFCNWHGPEDELQLLDDFLFWHLGSQNSESDGLESCSSRAVSPLQDDPPPGFF
ncbi:hypothetical protein PVAG01_04669 [Phlyctema vagabunda]|uniref:Uncharacterized protein n=1 Tax=Phlyctema vagabunda TaxID=108571 RepID=A0ABR4PHV5_9HELO